VRPVTVRPQLIYASGVASDWVWNEWARNARKMYSALIEEGFTEPQALIMVGQMIGAVISTPK
jgi:hypothetical protein